MAAAAVDVGYLAASYSIPETTFQSLLSEPTVELVQSLLVQIEAKARAYDDLQSDKLKVDVELDTAVQDGERAARALRAAAETAQKEAEELRQKLAQQENARQQIETELQNLQNAATSSTSEVQALESRVKTLESQNRDALAMHEAKVAAYDRLAKELSEQHQKFVDLRKQVSTLEEKNQSLENAATSVKFRETNFQQEIELLRKNNEWYTTELKTRSDDHAKYRKEKNAQIAELQRVNADASATIDTLQRTETSQGQRIEELKQQVDEYFARIEQLENEATQKEASFRSELDGARRLATLHQESAELVKGRLQQVLAELETLKDNAALEIGQLQAEVESEQNKVAELEGQIAELELAKENLESQMSEFKSSAVAPSTPRRPMNASFETPGRAGSPALFSPGGSRFKGGMSVTQLYAENAQLKTKEREAREREEQQAKMMKDMMDELERWQPEIEELRRDNEVLTAQTGEISALLDEATAEREAARKEARKALGDLEGVHRECKLLHQHVQDLTTQMQTLLWRQAEKDQGLESLTQEQRQWVEATRDNRIPAEQIQDVTATDRIISEHLLLFTNVTDLQTKNAELLRTIRQVAESFEGVEAQNKLEQQEKDRQELENLRSKLADADDQIRSLELRSQSVSKERDMYRRIVTNRGHQQPGADFDESFGNRSTTTPPPGRASLLGEQTPHSKEIAGYEKLIKDLQSHLDLLREENATDRAMLKQQVDSLTKETNNLQSERLRLDNQVRREQDRYVHLERTIKVLQSEKDLLQQRYDDLHVASTKRDNQDHQTAIDLADAQAKIDGLGREIAHLKASQDMWKTIEARLTERNKELAEEKDRLSKMVDSIQSLRNEQELTNAENRRRLQDRVSTLEAELQTAQQKLEREIENHNKALLQRDYERSEAQRRVDDLVKAKNDAEVKFASADTARQQLEQRVNELQTQLQSAEERAQSLRPQPTPRTNAPSEGDDSANQEEELTMQIEELQHKLERKQEDLEAVNSQIADYQAIAQECEDRLQSFMEAHEQLQEELNAAQQEKDTMIDDLQRRVEEISSELATSNTELTELRGQHEQETLRLTQEKDSLETEIARLKDDVNDYKAEVENQSQLVASQAEIATRAQQDYEHELAKHGETMKSLRTIRDEHSQVKTEIAQFKAQAEAARASLAQSEDHWKTLRQQYEDQVAEAKRSRDGLKEHNQALLRQFDDYKAQIENLKGSRVSVVAGDAEGTSTGSNGLQEIVDYLRREKEILEVQLNLKDQEVKRLEQQLAHAQNQLDQTREKLIAEQSKAHSSQSGTNLESIQKQIEQLNVYRESTTTLRNENGRLEAQLAEKNKALEDLHSQLEPLEARVADLEGEIELHVGHLKAVEEDRDRWQKRHQDVLQRYDRIDPKELEDLKQRIETLQSERDQATEEVVGLNEKIQTMEAAQKTAIEEIREAITAEVAEAERTKARTGFNKVHNMKMAEKAAVIKELQDQIKDLQDKLTPVQQELEESKRQSEAAQAQAGQLQEQLVALQQELEQSKAHLNAAQQELQAANAARDEALAHAATSGNANVDANMDEEGQVNESTSGTSTQEIEQLKSQLLDAQKKASEAQNNVFAAQNQVAKIQVELSGEREKVKKLDKTAAENVQRIVQLQEELDAARAVASQPQLNAAPVEQSNTVLAEQSTAPPTAEGLEKLQEEIAKLKEELAAAHKEIEELRARPEVTESAEDKPESDAKAQHDENEQRLAAVDAELKEREAKLAQRETRITNREAKAETLREMLNNKLKEAKQGFIAQTEQLKADHQAEIDRIRKEVQASGAQNSASAAQEIPKESATPSAASKPETSVKIEGLPAIDADDEEVKAFFAKNSTALSILRKNVNGQVDIAKRKISEEHNKLKAELELTKGEYEKLKAQKVEALPQDARQESTTQNLEAELAKAKAEFEKTLKEALEKREAEVKHAEGLKARLKDGQLGQARARWSVVEKAAKETPTEEVLKVYEVAKNAKAPQKPAVTPSTPAKPQAPVLTLQSAQSRPSAPAQPTPTATPSQQQAAAGTPTVPQANGANVNAPVQALQPTPSSLNASQPQPNPFLQAQAGQTTAPNPFSQAQNQMGRGFGNSSGIAPPGFTGQGPPPASQIQPPQQQQAGRGSFGTGPRALQGIIGAQIQNQIPSNSGIPRGGASSIPLPGGRGGGRGQQQNQIQTPQASQIGRGGGRGAAAGRGRGQNNNSPRTSLNPGAQQFQPGGGRGQKRGPEDEGDGSARGGKRPRGRGGQGGGQGTAE